MNDTGQTSWEWVEDGEYPQTLLVPAGWDESDDPPRKDVVMAVYESHGGGHMPEEPHKSLIAAAPALLAACEAMQFYMPAAQAAIRTTGATHGRPDVYEADRMAIAAIKKAKPEGEPA